MLVQVLLDEKLVSAEPIKADLKTIKNALRKRSVAGTPSPHAMALKAHVDVLCKQPEANLHPVR